MDKAVEQSQTGIKGSNLLTIAILIGICFASVYWLTPYYFNHAKDADGKTYANIYKMLLEHPQDQQLRDMVRDIIEDDHVSAFEWSTLLEAYNKEHGTHYGIPMIIGQDVSETYPLEFHKNELKQHYVFSGKADCKSKVTGDEFTFNTNMNQAYGKPYLKTNEKGMFIVLIDGSERFAAFNHKYHCFDEKENWWPILRAINNS